MPCQRCGNNNTAVTDSRKTEVSVGGVSTVLIRRRRKCLTCRHRANTYEQWATEVPHIYSLPKSTTGATR